VRSTCPKCDRAFIQVFPLVRHIHTVHSPELSDEARTLPKKKVKEDGKTRAVVPYVSSKRGTGGECGDCPKDPAKLPGHPNCTCEPEGGWDSYLTVSRANIPTNWTEPEWHGYVDTLRAEKVAT